MDGSPSQQPIGRRTVESLARGHRRDCACWGRGLGPVVHPVNPGPVQTPSQQVYDPRGGYGLALLQANGLHTVPLGTLPQSVASTLKVIVGNGAIKTQAADGHDNSDSLHIPLMHVMFPTSLPLPPPAIE